MVGTSAVLPAAPRPDILLIDVEHATSTYVPLLTPAYGVAATASPSVALEYMRRITPALVVTALFDDERGLEICRVAKGLSPPSNVLVTTPVPERVPDALRAGCDSVLLQPFAPNLLMSRIGRLLRERSNQLRLHSARAVGKSAHLSERIQLSRAGANRVWPNAECPYCHHSGIISFDYASLRRAWYACLACSRVWLAPRRE